MNQPRTIGMMINHHEIEHTLTSMADVIRNAAYKVATARYPIGHSQRDEFFDETGTLLAYDEMSIKSLLKDALEHYLQFNAGMQNPQAIEFNYYLSDTFKLVHDHINSEPHVLSFLSAQFAMACGNLAGMLSPVIEDLSRSGQGIEKVESFTMNTDESYYLVYGENHESVETYDPKDDDLKSMVINDTPEVLANWEVKKRQIREQEDNQAYGEYTKALKKAVDEAIDNPTQPLWKTTIPRVRFNGIRDTSVLPIIEAHHGPTEHGHSWGVNVTMPPAIFPELGLK
jgi:hypothetical protein